MRTNALGLMITYKLIYIFAAIERRTSTISAAKAELHRERERDRKKSITNIYSGNEEMPRKVYNYKKQWWHMR